MNKNFKILYSNMEFIPHQEAIQLKELGFDEPCWAWWHIEDCDTRFCYSEQRSPIINSRETEIIGLPTYSQAFKWFKDKHGLYYHILPEFYVDGINFNWQILWYLPKKDWTDYVISDGTGLCGDNGEYPSQEDAELACLNKLIQLVKNKEI